MFYNLLLESGCLAAPEQSYPFYPLVCLITFGIRLFQNFNSFALYFLFFLGLHVKGQVGSVYFGELWPRYRRIGAIRMPENEAKSDNEELDGN